MINRKNETIFPFHYDEVGLILTKLQKKVFLLRKGEHWGLVDSIGNVMVPFQYKDLQCNLDGVLTGNKEGRLGIIDFKGKKITFRKHLMIM